LSSSPATPVSVGTRIERARIAAWLVKPPSSVTIPSTWSFSRLNMSTIESSRATST
jgi:hypothetical protein